MGRHERDDDGQAEPVSTDPALDATVASGGGGADLGVETTLAAGTGESGAPAPGGADPSRALDRGATLGRYVVLDLLGAGGMGEVYAAYDPELDRKIALKVIRPSLVRSTSSTMARARLVREAQAMAQLAHPNVISVFDVGTVGDDVYVAMEHVDGSDLRRWLRAEPRDYPEVLEVFSAAARGLAAAHQAGVIHRDFKPDNVLYGTDGRVRVIDFGLARQAESDGEGAPATLDRPRRASAGDDTATDAGSLLGTPAYMAPEQFAGEPTDARTDQFNFAASLYEALYGQRPFAGDDLPSLADSVLRGQVRPPPANTEVPPWLTAAVLRALSDIPDNRFASMDELITALTPPRPRRLGWIALAIAAVVLGGGGLAAMALAGGGPAPCQDLDAELSGVWDDERKRAVEGALVATGAPHAGAVWTRVEAALDDYARAWTATRVEACRATAVRRTQSEDVLARRMACLDRRLRELDAVVAVMAGADADVLDNAVQAAGSLSPVGDCSNQSRLLAAPTDAGAALDGALARVRALDAAGKYHEARARAAETLETARADGARSAEALALYWMGTLDGKLGDAATAAETLFAAIRAAVRAGDPPAEALAWVELVAVTAIGLGRVDEAARWAEHAEVAIEAAGGDLALEARLRHGRGIIHFNRKRHDAALADFRAAAALHARAHGDDDWRVAISVGMAGSTLRRAHRYEEAAAEHLRAVAALEAALGPEHPNLAAPLNNLGISLSRLDRADEAREAYARSLAIKRQSLGDDHPSLAATEVNLGMLAERAGDYATAASHFARGLAIRERSLGADNPAIPRTQQNLARIAVKQGDLPRARALYQEVLVRFETVHGPEHDHTANLRVAYCDTLRRLGELRAARTECERAATALADAADPHNLAWALTHTGLVDLALGRAAVALDRLERAHALRAEALADPRYAAETAFVLARALIAAGGDEGRALALARDARATLAAVPPGEQAFLPDVDAWLAEHDAR